ncbi:MAG: DNA repair protein RecO [Candidatus Paceibacterota bacterium]
MQAVILKKIPVKEYDELIVCYTKDLGKQVYHAKSILRPTSKQASHLDVLNFVDFSLVEGNGHPIVTSAYCLKAFAGLKSSLPAMSAAYFLLEAFDKIVFEGEQDAQLWDFLLSRLNDYDAVAKTTSGGIKWADAINSSRREMLKVLGYGEDISLEEVANAHFRSLQFARKVIK